MRSTWKLTLYSFVAVDGIATYFHHPSAWWFTIAGAVMIIMSCLAELIADLRGF